MLRRGAEAEKSRPVLGQDPVRMDIERHIVSVDGEQIALPLRSSTLLEYPMHQGPGVDPWAVDRRVWGADYVRRHQTLDVRETPARQDRNRPGEDGWLVTVRGLGLPASWRAEPADVGQSGRPWHVQRDHRCWRKPQPRRSV